MWDTLYVLLHLFYKWDKYIPILQTAEETEASWNEAHRLLTEREFACNGLVSELEFSAILLYCQGRLL